MRFVLRFLLGSLLCCVGARITLSTVPTAQGQTIPIAAPTAVYSVRFTSTWSNTTHPHADFPSGAHFSALIGATHTISTTIWQPTALASIGIEEMAETGSTNQLRDEFTALADAILLVIQAPALQSATGTVEIPTIQLDRQHPAVTLVTMIAPSPDWFVGVHGISLLDPTGAWRDEVVVTLYPYDAGTDDGDDYTAANAEADPHQPIQQLRGVAPFSSAPIGSLTFTRQPQHTFFLPLMTR